jgi:type II secretory pathway component GspD/PulD (secretin)
MEIGRSGGRTVGRSDGRCGAGSGRLTDRPTDRLSGTILLFFLCLSLAGPASAQDSLGVHERNDSVSIRFVDSDIRAVVQALGRYLPKPVLVAGLPGNRVSLETQGLVSRGTVAAMLRGLVESQNLLFQEDSAFIRIGPKPEGVGRSDGQTDTAVVELFVLRLKHARAADVAATVNLLFGGSGEFSGRTGVASGTLSDELRRQAVPPARPPDRPSDRPTARPPASLSGPVTIVPDELTNSLLLRASVRDRDVILAAVEQLDVRPLQVMIEVLIVEARRTKDFSVGTSLFLPPQHIKGDADGTIGGQTQGAGLGDLVLRLLNLGRADIDATISASESQGNVKIVSRPVLLASNNTEASFLVGSQRPFVQVSRLLATDNNNQDRVVQYRDVGTRLRVRPTINQDGYVSLVIQQEINAATNEVAFDAPVISTREAQTQVLVRDGQTIMLGGLQDQQRDRSRSGIPVLSGLPLVGPLFGATTHNDSQTELYLFITPRILRTDEDADRITAPHLPEGEK